MGDSTIPDYETLLDRCYDRLSDVTTSTRLSLPPLVVGRVGTKRTQIVNCAELCSRIGRDVESLREYIKAEFGCDASISEGQALTLKGRFKTSQLEMVVKKYIRERVACRVCRGLKTEAYRENRIDFIRCLECHSAWHNSAL